MVSIQWIRIKEIHFNQKKKVRRGEVTIHELEVSSIWYNSLVTTKSLSLAYSTKWEKLAGKNTVSSKAIIWNRREKRISQKNLRELVTTKLPYKKY